MLNADLEPLSRACVFGYARWNKDCVKGTCEVAQDWRVVGASEAWSTDLGQHLYKYK